ncbi:beta-galactosidase-1-like protein 2 isoform X2 [Macrosteles quadrilineatus]|uniref:beta-galactosidase-1-like protein 2 isoform X2 n=1 Tax=Macrosteles quadrilineatus TaxID=74068 RepID=UPI0023E15E66|nr:beta-galactosidase-1-like protein 2 isoform X2 [Macrosteles quadrilineatus]
MVRLTFSKVFFVGSLLFIVFVLITSIIYLKMASLPATVYRYYGIDGPNVGLTTTNPNVFTLNGLNLTITSGTIHYFRVHPHYWRDRLRKLRALGAVAVETYAPWNLHEPYKDVYDFGDGGFEMSRFLDVVKFINMAKEEDLLVIFRPGPYICAEWDFGGLPSYLLADGAKVRSTDPKFLSRVDKYFGQLLPLVTPLQMANGGPIIMFQVENEYGSLRSPEHQYMVELKKMMDRYGVKGLYFTADSPEPSLETGAIPELNVLQTANFKMDPELQLATLRQLQPDKPILVTEFWTGWFDHWDKPVHEVFPALEYLQKLKTILEYPASVNLYVFHGGTTFGFLNGANNDDTEESYHPDTSSYDYDALVTEAGDYTPKYSATLQMFRNLHPNLYHPPPPPVLPRTLSLSLLITQELPWTQIVKQLPEPQGVLKNRKDFIFMEDLPADERGWKQSYGYVRYTRGLKVTQPKAKLRLTGRIRDIAIVLVNGKRQTIILNDGMETTQFGFWASQEEELELSVDPGDYTLEILVENCGRINFVKTLEWLMQKKGLGPDNQMSLTGGEFTSGIDVTGMPFLADWVTSLPGWQDRVTVGEKAAPSLVKASFGLSSDKISDTFLDVRGWKQGVVYVNGFNIGRYFAGGPQQTMYIPAPLLRAGQNTIIIFEHYFNAPMIQLVTEPSFLKPASSQ